MALAIVSACGYALDVSQAAEHKGEYVLVLSVTGAATDVTHDLDDLSGTFWTSALAHATYGENATIVTNKITELTSNVIDSEFFSRVLNIGYVRVAGATGGATEYQVDGFGATNLMPSIKFHAASAPTAYVMSIRFKLGSGKYLPASFNVGTTL